MHALIISNHGDINLRGWQPSMRLCSLLCCLALPAAIAGGFPDPVQLFVAAVQLLLMLPVLPTLLLLLLLGATGRSAFLQSCIIRLYIQLPLNSLSRAWGRCHRRPLPRPLRAPLYRLYSRLYGCDLSETVCHGRLVDFQSLSEFFARDLRPGIRPICPTSDLVSPVDGRLLSFGRVRSGHLEQVKGVTYSLQGFLGPDFLSAGGCCPPPDAPRPAVWPTESPVPDAVYQGRLKLRSSSELYHCAIYLAPGDYHKFHSPANWTVRTRRHFAGRLLSVAPSVAARISSLFCINERAAYAGEWKHGFLCMVAVGATGVGSICVACDPDLATNQSGPRSAAYYDKRLAGPACHQSKGQLFGQFNLGSTIVLLFEAPYVGGGDAFKFDVQPGQRIRLGEAIGSVSL